MDKLCAASPSLHLRAAPLARKSLYPQTTLPCPLTPALASICQPYSPSRRFIASPRDRAQSRVLSSPLDQPTPPPPHSDDDRSLRRPAGAGGRSAALRRRAPAAVQWCANHSAATRARLYAPTIGAFAATGGVCASNWIRLRASLRSRLLDCAKSGGAHCTSRWPVPRTSHLPLSQTQNHRRARCFIFFFLQSLNDDDDDREQQQHQQRTTTTSFRA